MNTSRFQTWLVLILAGILSLLILFPSNQGAAQQPLPTPTPYYLPSELILDEAIDFPLCWVGYIDTGMRPCADTSAALQNIDTVWPTTVRIIEFSVQADTWWALEVNRVIDDTYPGTLGVDIQFLDANGNWANLAYFISVPTTGTTTNKGVPQGQPVAADWMNKIPYENLWDPVGPGKYRILVYSQVVTNNGAVYGYWPSRGTIKVYRFDGTPPPSEPPAQMGIPTLTTEAGKPPVSGDLSIEDRIAPFQAVQGDLLVSGRPVAVVVKPIWVGTAPSVPVDCQVTIDIDGSFSIQKTGAVGSDIEFILPASIFPEGVTADHVMKLHAEPIGAAVDDPISDNDFIELPFTTYASRPLRLLFMRILPGDVSAISVSELNRFAGDAIRYLWQVYPVPRVSRVSGSFVTLPGTSTKISASVAVAKTLLLYNNSRCREVLPDGTSRPISPCNVPKADMAVGVFPDHYYGDEIEGWLYGRGSKTWTKWMDWTAEGFGWVSGGRSEIDRAAMTSATNYINTAHEIGHHFDLDDEHDPGMGFGILLDNVYIWENGKIIYLDQNYRTSNKIARYINFMGEAGVDIQYGNHTWVNDETWNHILNQIEQRGMAFAPVEVASLDYVPPLQEVSYPPLSPHSRHAYWSSSGQAEGQEWGEERGVDGPALLVMGTLDAQSNASIQTIDQLSHFDAPTDTGGDYRLAALDGQGNIVGWTDFNSYPLDIDQQVPFLVTIPLEGTLGVFGAVNEVRLSRNGTAIASVSRSSSAPTASLAATPDLSADPVALSWTAQDADGGSLRSSVYYTVDGGQTWQVVALDLSTTQLEIEPASLAGGNAQFRVVVSDGMNETTLLTSPLPIPDRPPEVVATLPWGGTFIEGQPVIASVYGYDPEDGDLPEPSLIWIDETGQQIGEGKLLRVPLEPGAHTLFVIGTDSQGQEANASVAVMVEKQTTSTPRGGLPSFWFYLLGGVMTFFGLVGAGWGTFLVLRPVENPLARLYHEGLAWWQRYRAGQVHPTQLAQIQQRLQAHDGDGNLWSFDVMRGQWLLWDGRAWRLSPPPGNIRQRGRFGCGLLWISGSLLLVILAVVAMILGSGWLGSLW